jgi:hypothetical protein
MLRRVTVGRCFVLTTPAFRRESWRFVGCTSDLAISSTSPIHHRLHKQTESSREVASRCLYAPRSLCAPKIDARTAGHATCMSISTRSSCRRTFRLSVRTSRTHSGQEGAFRSDTFEGSRERAPMSCWWVTTQEHKRSCAARSSSSFRQVSWL